MKSLIELAFDFISEQKEGVSFSKLWDHVKKEANLDEEAVAKKISQFYTNLMLDGRFVNLGDNTWDLRNRHTFDKVHIDMKDVYSDVDTSDNDAEEIGEEEEYNQALEENDNFDDKESGFGEDEDLSEDNSNNRNDY